MARFKRYNAECSWLEEIWKSLRYEKWLFLKVFQGNVKPDLNFIKALAQAVYEEINWEREEDDAPEHLSRYLSQPAPSDSPGWDLLQIWQAQQLGKMCVILIALIWIT